MKSSPQRRIARKCLGNSDVRRVGNITISSMDPDYRKQLHLAVDEYKKHLAKIREWKPGHRSSIYGFAYWLFRWSGLVAIPTRKGPLV